MLRCNCIPRLLKRPLLNLLNRIIITQLLHHHHHHHKHETMPQIAQAKIGFDRRKWRGVLSYHLKVVSRRLHSFVFTRITVIHEFFVPWWFYCYVKLVFHFCTRYILISSNQFHTKTQYPIVLGPCDCLVFYIMDSSSTNFHPSPCRFPTVLFDTLRSACIARLPDDTDDRLRQLDLNCIK